MIRFNYFIRVRDGPRQDFNNKRTAFEYVDENKCSIHLSDDAYDWFSKTFPARKYTYI